MANRFHAFLLFVCVAAFAFCSCNSGTVSQQPKLKAEHLHAWNCVLEEAIVHDFFTPPVASRMYVYPNIAAYEALATQSVAYSVLSSSITATTFSENRELKFPELSSLFAFYFTARELVYAVDILDTYEVNFRKQLQEEGWAIEDIDLAKADGKEIAARVLDWAKADQYPQMRSMPAYQVLDAPGSWKPTPPDYTAAMEPHWPKLRPFTLDSAAQFKPAPPTAFDADTASPFYREVLEVYHALRNNSEETTAIAKFWDCNPLVRKHQGHVSFAEKKLTPGGHWISIGRMVMTEQGLDLMETSHAYTLLCIAISDAFISCWDEKYRSNYIRPVTFIHEQLDPEWHPILYTPNFPEYPSGHSVVSGAAATVLTELFGENYAFTDSTEVPYGMPPRSFNSFIEASEEAAISRLYGGIHFRPAVENGKVQGRAVGQHVLERLQLQQKEERVP